MQKIVPNIWCQGNAAAAGELYATVLPGATSEVVATYPTENLPDFQRELAGQPLVVDVSTNEYRVRLINAGNDFRPTPAISFILKFDSASYEGGDDAARTQIQNIWNAFSDGGTPRMELGEYPHSKFYGWIEDRFGVNWQLMLAEPSDGPGLSVIPQLLFTGAEVHAQEAMNLYTGLFPDSGTGMVAPRPDGSGGVMFAEFTLAGQPFSAMDGGSVHNFTFSPGLSLEVDCDDQDEIDRLWDVLSAVPEAEQCGWLADKFGVSWQIVPKNMGELMQSPGAYQRMLQMKKIIIAEL